MPPEHAPDLSTLGVSGLFSLYRAILSELKDRGVIRTENAPVGDYAEYLLATALDGQPAPNSEKSWDVLTNDGEKLQVKARVVSEPAEPGQLQLSPFRSFNFDFAVIVLLSATDYAVTRAAKVPRHVVESSAIYRQHVNGKVLFARPQIKSGADVMSAELGQYQRRIPCSGHTGPERGWWLVSFRIGPGRTFPSNLSRAARSRSRSSSAASVPIVARIAHARPQPWASPGGHA